MLAFLIIIPCGMSNFMVNAFVDGKHIVTTISAKQEQAELRAN